VIPAGVTFNYECKLSVENPGPFEAQLNIHLEENGIRTVTITVRGVAVAPGAGNATPK
jgi:hypothetical protein